jgi:hypothetical protein
MTKDSFQAELHPTSPVWRRFVEKIQLVNTFTCESTQLSWIFRLTNQKSSRGLTSKKFVHIHLGIQASKPEITRVR